MLQTDTLSTLSAQQVQAIELLVVGTSVTHTADHTGVARSTIHRWLREDFEFQAELNRAKRALCREAETRIVAILDAALDVIQSAIGAGDAKVALSILKGAGLLSGRPIAIGEEQADMLRRIHAQEIRETETQLGFREMTLSF